MSATDIERVARVICRVTDDMVCDDAPCPQCLKEAIAAMAETRRIDAEALVQALASGDIYNNVTCAADWLKGRADAE